MTNFEILKREIAECRIRAKSQETIEVLTYLQEFAENILNNGWISVDDGLPEPMQKVLIFGRNYKEKQAIDTGYHMPELVAEFGVNDSFLNALHVTHWQPLPEPPEEQ